MIEILFKITMTLASFALVLITVLLATLIIKNIW